MPDDVPESVPDSLAAAAQKGSKKSSRLTGLNLLGKATGWWGPFYSKRVLNQLSPAEQAPLLKEYYLSMGFDPKKTDEYLPKADGFGTYQASRIANLDGFSKVKALEKASEKLPDGDPAVDAVKKAISDAFKLTDKTGNRRAEFEKGMAEVKAAIENPEALYDPETMLTRMHKLHSRAHGGIAAQHAKETKELKDVLEDPTHAGTLKTKLGLNDKQYEEMKTEMLTTLAASQKKELAEFDKAINEPLKKMHSLAQLEVDRLFYLSTLHTHNKAMQIEIDRLHDANAQEGSPSVSIQQGRKRDRALFKGMKVSDLETLQTITGRPINKEADGSFSMEFPNRITSIGYYNSSDEKMKSDWMGLAGAVRASGYDSVTLEYSHKNEEHAMKQGRMAFEAAREMGFDTNKITITVNGKDYKGKKIQEELFKDDPTRFQAINKSATASAEARRKAVKEFSSVTDADAPDTKNLSNAASYHDLKTRLAAGRDAMAKPPTTPGLEDHEAPSPT